MPAGGIPCRDAIPCCVGYHALRRARRMCGTLLPSRWFGDQISACWLSSAANGHSECLQHIGADSLRTCLPIWQGGAAAAVMVAGSPNVTAVYEVGTRAQQVLETVSSALSRAPPRPQWACACASVYEAPGLARTCYAHSFVIMHTAHGTRHTAHGACAAAYSVRTAAGAVRAEEGGRRWANWTHSGVPSKDLQDPSFADLCAPTAAAGRRDTWVSLMRWRQRWREEGGRCAGSPHREWAWHPRVG
jgi:hypothetical protein